MATYAAYRHIELDNIGYGKKRVLKPPGGGSSDIFGANGQEPSTPEPRRGRNHQSSSLFLGDEMDNKSTSSASSNKPGNDSHQRLFGEADMPKTPSVNRNRMKSNIVLEHIDTTNHTNNRFLNPITLNGNNNSSPAINGSDTNGNKSPSITTSSSSTMDSSTTPRSLTPRSHPSTPNGNFSPREGSGKASFYTPRNPVTGDGYGFVPARLNQPTRRKDGNPVTGEGYENAKPQSAQLSNGGSVSSQNGTAPPPSTATAASARQRVPPGGFSSGLW